jgi:hypothetical protein
VYFLFFLQGGESLISEWPLPSSFSDLPVNVRRRASKGM